MASRRSLSAIATQTSLLVASKASWNGSIRQNCSRHCAMSNDYVNNKQQKQVRFMVTLSFSPHQKRSSHCATCTCPEEEEEEDYYDGAEHHVRPRQSEQSPPTSHHSRSSSSTGACGRPMEADPSPLSPIPEPKFCFLRRVLDTNLLTPLSTSSNGRRYLMDALQQHTAAAYWQLTEHAVHQLDPAYCGITTLLVVLNSMCMDPNVRWRGGWRYFGNEDVLLQQCCLSPARIQRIGIHLEEFAQLATCHGLQVQYKRPNTTVPGSTLDDFRADVVRLLTEPTSEDDDDHENQGTLPSSRDWGVASSVIVVSFARPVLGQTGEGHFSPLAAYHAATDQVLVLDVARFKYAPYWVPVKLLYQAMIPSDPRTNQSRGWFLLHPPPYSNTYQGRNITDEVSRPAHLVPKVVLSTHATTTAWADDHTTNAEAPMEPSGTCPVNNVKKEHCHKNRKPNGHAV